MTDRAGLMRRKRMLSISRETVVARHDHDRRGADEFGELPGDRRVGANEAAGEAAVSGRKLQGGDDRQARYRQGGHGKRMERALGGDYVPR